MKKKPKPRPKSKLRIEMEKKRDKVRMTLERFTALRREMNRRFGEETAILKHKKNAEAKARQVLTGKDRHNVQRGKRSKKHPKGAGI